MDMTCHEVLQLPVNELLDDLLLRAGLVIFRHSTMNICHCLEDGERHTDILHCARYIDAVARTTHMATDVPIVQRAVVTAKHISRAFRAKAIASSTKGRARAYRKATARQRTVMYSAFPPSVLLWYWATFSIIMSPSDYLNDCHRRNLATAGILPPGPPPPNAHIPITATTWHLPTDSQ